VSCHNYHPDTPKSNWEVGDIRGILVVTVPLEGSRNEQSKSLHDSRFTLIFFLFILFGIVLTSLYVIENYIKRD
tara:strand:- start:281 stop:502 length:222 start_codon:yes stop_codon:yes gene_type:complete